MPEDQFNSTPGSPTPGGQPAGQPPSDGTWAPPSQPTQPVYPPPVDPYATGTGYQPPTYEAPKYETPSYETPSYQAPTYQAPTYPAASYPPPSYEAPTYQAPGPAPTTAQPAFPPPTAYQPGSSYPPSVPAPGTTAWMPGAPQPSTPWAAPPGPASPARSFRTRTLVLVVVVTALVCACGGFFGGVASNVGSTAKTTTKAGAAPEPTVSAKVTTPAKATASAATTIAPGDGKALKAHLAKAPSGAKTYSVDNSSGGVMTLDQFVKNGFDGDADEKARLEQRGFKVAVENDWTGKDAVEVSTQLIQFSAASGAEDYVTGQHGAFVGDKDVKASYKIPGTTLGYGFEKPAMGNDGTREAVLICQDGPIVVVMFIDTPGQFNRTSEIATLQRQLDALDA